MAVLLLLGSGLVAHAQDVPAEDGFAARIAEERSSRGIPSLAFAADLQVVARRHAQRMVDSGKPYHNPDLATEVDGWSIVAENVGVGPSVDPVHEAFMQSATHRDIILNPDLTQLGVGVVRSSDGRIWVVEVFRRPQEQPPPPTSAPPTTAAPASTAPPSTAARPTSAVRPPIAPTTVAEPTSSTTSTTDASLVAALPRTTPSEDAAFTARSGTPAAVGRIESATAPIDLAPDLASAARSVPPAAWAAAFLLAGVVGLQGQALRRLGLVA